MNRFLLIFILSFVLTACSQTTQTTSGRAYLDQYQYADTDSVGENTQGLTFDQQVREVAKVEPILKFPARIGLARIDRGRLTAVPGDEIEAWMETREKLGDKFGEFIPVNPLIANMVSQSVDLKNYNVINKIRLGAARQHLDAVLIYEVYSKSETNKNALAVADLTIIGGYLLPSRAETTEGFATALLIDVLQGYPYGTAQASVDKQKAISSTWGWGEPISEGVL